MIFCGFILFYLLASGLGGLLEIWLSGGKLEDAILMLFWLPATIFVFAVIVLTIPLILVDRAIHLGKKIGRKTQARRKK